MKIRDLGQLNQLQTQLCIVHNDIKELSDHKQIHSFIMYDLCYIYCVYYGWHC